MFALTGSVRGSPTSEFTGREFTETLPDSAAIFKSQGHCRISAFEVLRSCYEIASRIRGSCRSGQGRAEEIRHQGPSPDPYPRHPLHAQLLLRNCVLNRHPGKVHSISLQLVSEDSVGYNHFGLTGFD